MLILKNVNNICKTLTESFIGNQSHYLLFLIVTNHNFKNVYWSLRRADVFLPCKEIGPKIQVPLNHMQTLIFFKVCVTI